MLRPLVELLERDGHEVELTARPLSHTVELLDDWGHPYTVLGRHGGAGAAGKARAAAERVRRMLRFGRRRRFDCALGARARPTCRSPLRALRVPNTTMFDYEWATLQHHVNCRFADRVLVPDAIPAERLRRYGAQRRRSSSATPASRRSTTSPASSLTRPCSSGSACRPAPSCASSAPRPRTRSTSGAPRADCCRVLLRRLTGDEEQVTVVLARTPEQRAAVGALGLPR